MKNTEPEDSVIIISADVPDIYPHILVTERKNGSRYLFHYPLFMLKNSVIPNAKSDEERRLLQAEYARIVDEPIIDLKKSDAKLVLTAEDVLDRRVLSYLKERYENLGEIEARYSRLQVWKRAR